MASEDLPVGNAHSTIDRGKPTRRLRIAICISHFHPVIGGSERQMQRLAERWTQRGHQVSVLTRTRPDSPRHEMLGDVAVHRVIRAAELGPAFGATFISSLAAQLIGRARSFDIMVAAQLPWESVATGIAAKVLRKPAVAFVASTGAEGDARQLLRAKGSRLLLALARNNSRLIALSDQGRRELLELGCPAETILQSTNGVDVEQFRPFEQDDKSARTVLFLSRLVTAKNPHVLLRAWANVNREGRFPLLIGGDGPMAGELRQLAAELELKNVEFLGQVSDVAAVHRRASVFVLPSPSEGCSNALLEAMASGLCPVVTRVPGNIDVVQDDVNGLFFEHDNDEELAAALNRVLNDAALRSRLATAARRHTVECHNLDNIAAELIECFTELCGSR